MNPKEIRNRTGLSLIEAAVHAGASENTTRLYEANREAVSPKLRARLDAFYAGLRARASMAGLDQSEARAR
jgi:hypothetical protein